MEFLRLSMSVALIRRIGITHMREETVHFKIFVGLNTFDKLYSILRFDTNTMHARVDSYGNADDHIMVVRHFIESV